MEMSMSSLVAPRLIPSAAISTTRESRRVAVIGAGAAGLVAARELLREGHRVVVIERGVGVGGTWIYNPATESDPLGLDPNRGVVQSSLYDSLRTNLPRECMGFLDYPFSARRPHYHGAGDSRRFPGHREVLRYLEGFARDFDLLEIVRFRTEVMRVEREGDGRWSLKSRRIDVEGGGGAGAGGEREFYDALVICNGHYTEPRLALIPGIDDWPGKQIHSHNYRVPEPFHNQIVVIIGDSNSASDISRDLSPFAKEVHISRRSALHEPPTKLPGYDNIWLHSMIKNSHKDSKLEFEDGSIFHVDVILHCTGYTYHFPFLETDGIVSVDDNRVEHLYKHVFPPSVAPSLSFIGIPWKVIPFPLCELQSKWVAGILSGRIALPTQEEMMDDIRSFYLEMELAGLPKRYAHNFSRIQFEYTDWLANQCGHHPVEEWRKEMYMASARNKAARTEIYRDEWDDEHLVAQAEDNFQKFYRKPSLC